MSNETKLPIISFAANILMIVCAVITLVVVLLKLAGLEGRIESLEAGVRSKQSKELEDMIALVKECQDMTRRMQTRTNTLSQSIETISADSFGAGLFLGFRCKELGGTKSNLFDFLDCKRSNRLDIVREWFGEHR